MSDTDPRPSYFSQIRVDPNNEHKSGSAASTSICPRTAGRIFSDPVRARPQRHSRHLDRPGELGSHALGNDGGIWVTEDSGRDWRHINNIALGQFYEVASIIQKPYHVCGGLQDNYSWCGPSSTTQQDGIGNEDWITVQGGDGFYNRIDPSDPNIIYAESQDGNLSRRDLRHQRIEIASVRWKITIRRRATASSGIRR